MGFDPCFDVRVESRDGVAHLAVIGELDMATAPRLGEELVGVERDDVGEVTLDMHDVTFVDSSGLEVILGAWKRAQLNGHRLVVVRASRPAQQVCRIAGVEFILGDPSVTAVAGPAE